MRDTGIAVFLVRRMTTLRDTGIISQKDDDLERYRYY